MVENAPLTIPLWYINESTGYWVEEGEAILEGNKYIGNVNHFCFWNCDETNDFIYIEGIITDENQNAMTNYQVIIKEISSGITGVDWTDQNGVFAGAVPKDKDLSIEILDNCGEIIYSHFIGPYSADAIIPTITVTTTENFVTIAGNLTNCETGKHSQ